MTVSLIAADLTFLRELPFSLFKDHKQSVKLSTGRFPLSLIIIICMAGSVIKHIFEYFDEPV